MQIEWPNEDLPGGAEKRSRVARHQGHRLADAPPGEGEKERTQSITASTSSTRNAK